MFSFFRIMVFLSLSDLVIRSIALRHFISNTSSASISFRRVVHESEPYVAIGRISVPYSLVLRFIDTSFDGYIVDRMLVMPLIFGVENMRSSMEQDYQEI